MRIFHWRWIILVLTDQYYPLSIVSCLHLKLRINAVSFRHLQHLYMVVCLLTVKRDHAVFITGCHGAVLIRAEADHHSGDRFPVLVDHMKDIGCLLRCLRFLLLSILPGNFDPFLFPIFNQFLDVFLIPEQVHRDEVRVNVS